MSTALAPGLSKQTIRRIKRIQEMRNQLENLRKELVSDGDMNFETADAFSSSDNQLNKLIVHIERGV